MREILINGEWKLTLPNHRTDRKEYTDEHGWEKARLKSMSENLGKNDTVFYCGAEEGEHAALCAMWGAKVVMVEPNPKVWRNIRAIWIANNLPKPLGYFVGFCGNKIEPHPPKLDFEIGEKDGWPLCAYGEVIGNHGFRELHKQADSTPQTTIDELASHYGIPTAISLDVEGSEWRVLEGAEVTLKLHKPKIWLSGHPEMMFGHYGEYLYDLRGWLKQIGYKETILDYEHEFHGFYEAKK